MFLQDFKPTLKFRKSIFLESVDFSFCFFILQHINRLKKEARERGEEYKVTKLRRNLEMDEYDFIHWRRSLEEREALLRDSPPPPSPPFTPPPSCWHLRHLPHLPPLPTPTSPPLQMDNLVASPFESLSPHLSSTSTGGPFDVSYLRKCYKI